MIGIGNTILQFGSGSKFGRWPFASVSLEWHVMKQKSSFQAKAVVRWVQMGLNNFTWQYDSIRFGKKLILVLYSCACALWKQAEKLRSTMWREGILIIRRWLLHRCMKCSHWCATNLHQLSFTVEVEFVLELRYHTRASLALYAKLLLGRNFCIALMCVLRSCSKHSYYRVQRLPWHAISLAYISWEIPLHLIFDLVFV